MQTIQLIVECTINKEQEKLITQIGSLKYKLPFINSYVVEVPEEFVSQLYGIEGVKAIYEDTHITAQMHEARKVVKADYVTRDGATGKGLSVAILDTGVAPVSDLTLPHNRIVAFKDFIGNKTVPYDDNGHGTHVAGIACGNGYKSKGKYKGIAPESNIVAVKILDGSGKGNATNVLAGLQWILENQKKYNIKVANLSIGTEDIGNKDPLIRAVETCWDRGITMIVAAGNNGPRKGSITSPGISRKVITVGSSDDENTVTIWGSSTQNFSGRGPTSECIKKPDVVAPGANIVSCKSPTYRNKDELNKVVGEDYLKLSGTSMSTPIVSGGIALLLSKFPNMKPDEVKLKLKSSTIDLNYNHNKQGWGLIDLEMLLRSH